jgi:hypothetical protein
MTTSSSDPSHLARRLQAAGPSDSGSTEPAPDGDRDFEIRIARDGTWFYHGSPITRKPLVKLFSTVLQRDESGGYWLITPAERGRIEVEDAPFLAVELNVAGAGRNQVLTFRTNVDDHVTVDGEHPIRIDHNSATGEPSPYLLVRDSLEALIGRAVYYQLVDLGVEEEVGGRTLYGVWSGNAFFSLGALRDES